MPRKLPRGKGYDKAATLGHLRKMVKGGIFVTDYVKQAGLKLDTFMLAIDKYNNSSFVESTMMYACHPLVVSDPKLITTQCGYCDEVYWPTKQGTKWCSSYCGNAYRKDQDYFGGRRKDTVGLSEAVCQLCRRHVGKGLSSHHIYGKANDVENAFLLALCSGCHSVVSELARKVWIGDTDIVAKLIWLANTQRNGKEALDLRQKSNLGIRVEVSFHRAQYDQS